MELLVGCLATGVTVLEALVTTEHVVQSSRHSPARPHHTGGLRVLIEPVSTDEDLGVIFIFLILSLVCCPLLPHLRSAALLRPKVVSKFNGTGPRAKTHKPGNSSPPLFQIIPTMDYYSCVCVLLLLVLALGSAKRSVFKLLLSQSRLRLVYFKNKVTVNHITRPGFLFVKYIH
jgi:hypothetical protein